MLDFPAIVMLILGGAISSSKNRERFFGHCQYGCFLNGGTPISHPKMTIFSREKTHGFVRETHHFRKPPYGFAIVILVSVLGLTPSIRINKDQHSNPPAPRLSGSGPSVVEPSSSSWSEKASSSLMGGGFITPPKTRDDNGKNQP